VPVSGIGSSSTLKPLQIAQLAEFWLSVTQQINWVEMHKSGSLAASSVWATIFAGAFGGLLGLGLLKFGNPVILDHLMEPPKDWLEAVYVTWPSAWGYGLLFAVVLVGAPLVRLRTATPKWLIALPLVWLGWQFLSSTQTVDAQLTRVTLLHFTACVCCFFLGLFILSRVENMKYFWAALLLAMGVVIWMGFEQHFGGLEETRRYIWNEIYNHPERPLPSPEFLGKIKSDRIFATLAYPNTLAGVLILTLPPLLAALWQLTMALPRVLRLGLVGALLACGLATMYWSGSKAGWLIAVVMASVPLFNLSWPRTAKLAVIALLFIGGFTGLFLKYRSYFEKGATSAGARMDYWKAAWTTASTNPMLGTGPGTFQRSYIRLKPPQAEMTRLTHNDYLEQASDSGWPGFLTFCAFVWISMLRSYRQRGDAIQFFVWLGLFGWTLQSFVEFGLYIPAISWTAFALLGWLLGLENGSTTQRGPSSFPFR
jgi:hypothetical protein